METLVWMAGVVFVAWLSFKIGVNRGHNDQIQIKCEYCGIHKRYEGSLTTIRGLEETIHGLQSKNGKLASEVNGMAFRNSGFGAR